MQKLIEAPLVGWIKMRIRLLSPFLLGIPQRKLSRGTKKDAYKRSLYHRETLCFTLINVCIPSRNLYDRKTVHLNWWYNSQQNSRGRRTKEWVSKWNPLLNFYNRGKLLFCLYFYHSAALCFTMQGCGCTKINCCSVCSCRMNSLSKCSSSFPCPLMCQNRSS